MLVTMAALLVVGLFWLGRRWRDVPRRPLSEALLSRDAAFTLLMMAFLTVATLIGLGTSIPWISSVKGLGQRLQGFLGVAFTIDDGSFYGNAPFTDGRFSLTADFFRRTTPPIAVIIVLLMAVGPLFGWRDTNRAKLVRTIRWPAAVALAGSGVALFLGAHSVLALLYIGLATFAVATNVILIVRTLRSGWLRIGGYLAHVGMGLLLVGVVGSYTYSSQDVKLTITQGDTVSAFGHTFQFWGEETLPNGKTALRLELDRDSSPAVARPELFYNQRMGSWTRTPAIRRSVWQDLYISPADSQPASDPNTAQLGVGQVGKIGPYLIAFQGFEIKEHSTADSASVGASVVLTDTRTSAVRTLVPAMTLAANAAAAPVPLDLGAGQQLVLADLSAPNRQVLLRVTGLNLPLQPARAIIEVSTKPAIALVWTGALIMFLGAVCAWLRRRGELAATLAPVAAPGPAPARGGLWRAWRAR